MKFKIITWLIVIVAILSVEQIMLQIVLPEIDTATAVEQMRGQSMYDNGFTLRDAAKNSAGFMLCLLWTLCVFTGDILRASQCLISQIQNPERW